MLLAWLDVDHVARSDLSDVATATSDQTDAVGHVERPIPGVLAPGDPGVRREPAVSAADV